MRAVRVEADERDETWVGVHARGGETDSESKALTGKGCGGM